MILLIKPQYFGKQYSLHIRNIKDFNYLSDDSSGRTNFSVTIAKGDENEKVWGSGSYGPGDYVVNAYVVNGDG